MLASVLTPAPFIVFQRSSITPTSFSDGFNDGETEEDFVGADTDFETEGVATGFCVWSFFFTGAQY